MSWVDTETFKERKSKSIGAIYESIDFDTETECIFDVNNGTVTVNDLLYRQSLTLKLEDVEMIIKTIRKAHPDFLKG